MPRCAKYRSSWKPNQPAPVRRGFTDGKTMKAKYVYYARDINHAIISCLRVGDTYKAEQLRKDRNRLMHKARSAD